MGDIVPIRIKKGPDKGKVTRGATSWVTRWPDRFELADSPPAKKPASTPRPARKSSPKPRSTTTTSTKKGESE